MKYMKKYIKYNKNQIANIKYEGYFKNDKKTLIKYDILLNKKNELCYLIQSSLTFNLSK